MMLANPFEEILTEIREIKQGMKTMTTPVATQSTQTEIIDRKELLKRLDITEPTAIRYGKSGIIPEIHIGSTIRYNWPAVIQALESNR